LQSTIRNIPKPVIARVDSYAIGSGNALREKRKPGFRKYANK
jgi:1,4-dihydroxy-2-naphthoyl-CoA synthase